MSGNAVQPLGQYFRRVSYVVSKLDQAIEGCKAMFGVRDFMVVENLKLGPPNCLLRGSPATIANSWALGDMPGGLAEIELISPQGADGIFAEFLKQHGSGCRHHIGFRVPQFKPYAEHFAKLGYRPLMQGSFSSESKNDFGNYEFAYFDCRMDGGPIVEIYWQDEESYERLHPFLGLDRAARPSNFPWTRTPGFRR